MNAKMWLDLTVRDRRGRILSRSRRPAHSLVTAFARLLTEQMAITLAAPTLKDTSGITNTLVGGANNFAIPAAEGMSLIGIVVGTNPQAVVMGDWKLIDQIPHGVGAGQLYHWAQGFLDLVETATYTRSRWRRLFTNDSGASITIREAALYSVAMTLVGEKYACLARDLTGDVVVPVGATLTVVYIIDITLT